MCVCAKLSCGRPAATVTHSSVVQLLVASLSVGKVNQSGIAELRGVAGAGGRRLGLAVCSLPIAPSRAPGGTSATNGGERRIHDRKKHEALLFRGRERTGRLAVTAIYNSQFVNI